MMTIDDAAQQIRISVSRAQRIYGNSDPGAPLLPNGYGYTAGTPVTSSGPSGAMVRDDQGRCGGVQAIAKAEKAQQAAALASHPAGGNSSGDGGGGHPSGGTYSSWDCGRLGLSCPDSDPKKAVPKSSGFNLFHWIAHTALPWIVRNRINIADWAAFGGCILLSPVVCGILQAADYGIRVQARVQQYGWRASMSANTADFIYTAAGVGVGGVIDSEIEREIPLVKNIGKARAVGQWATKRLAPSVGCRTLTSP